MSIEDKRWRTLVRIVSIMEKSVCVVLPGWNPAKYVTIRIEDVPCEILEAFIWGKIRHHVEANLGAEHAREIQLSNWELG